MQIETYDIIIVGSGMVGAALACAVAQNTPLSIAVLEAKTPDTSWNKKNYQHRVSAINLASIQLLQALKVWDSIKEDRVSPFTEIKVWDAKGASELRFSCQDIAAPALGCIVENNLIQRELLVRMAQYPQITYFSPVELDSFNETAHGVEITASNGRVFAAKLAVAADGAHSWLREQAGISVSTRDYAEQALVATVHTEMAHHGIARQRFLKSGPVAFLPLADPHLSSIVWTLPTEQAKELMTLSTDKFCEQLESASLRGHVSARSNPEAIADCFDANASHHDAHRAFSLGNIELRSERYSFPLLQQIATHYLKSKVVLVGDAAHRVHPLAGQGVNIGFQDVAALVEVLTTALMARRDWSSQATLRRYERERKAENLPMLLGVNWIKNLYATEMTTAVQFRTFGPTMTQQFTWLRNIFIRHAVGKTSACESFI